MLGKLLEINKNVALIKLNNNNIISIPSSELPSSTQTGSIINLSNINSIYDKINTFY